MISIRKNLPISATALPERPVEALGANQMRLQRDDRRKRPLGLDGLRREDANRRIQRRGEQQKRLNKASSVELDGIRFHR